MTDGPCHPSGEECLNKQSDPSHVVTLSPMSLVTL